MNAVFTFIHTHFTFPKKYMLGTLQIISGKGGVGKSIVAAALAEQHAQDGRRTLLVSYDQLGKVHPIYRRTTGYEPANVRPNLDISSLDAHLALIEYVKRKMTFSFAYLPILENPAVVRFLDALPLFNELLVLGKLYDLVGKDSPYESVVFDAPATGHCKILLNMPAVALETLIAGPIYDNARKIHELLTNPERAELQVVTLPEETPMREARELIEFARNEGQIACTRLLVNRYREPRFTPAERRQLAAWGESAAAASALAPVLEFDAQIAQTQAAQADALGDLNLDTIRLPDLPPADPETLVHALQEHLG